MNDMQKVALVAGASGLVGQRLVTVLCEAREYSRVYALTWRPLTRDHQKLANRWCVSRTSRCNFGASPVAKRSAAWARPAGEAGSEAAFRQVDFELVLAFARAARAAQAQRFVLVSSVGADADSRSFYLRVKAQTEAAVMTLGFPGARHHAAGPAARLAPGSAPARARGAVDAAGACTADVRQARPMAAGRRGDARRSDARRGPSGRRGVARHTWPAIGALADRSVRD